MYINIIIIIIIIIIYQLYTSWLQCTVVEHQSLANKLSLSHARLAAVGKPSATGQPTRPIQPFILLGLIN